VVFVFATTEPQKIANTAAPILSRLQRFDFRRIGPHAIVARLKQVLAEEHLAAEDDALHLIAKSADGGMRDGLSLLDQVLSFGEGPVTAARVREVLGLIPDDSYGEMLRCIAERDAAAVFPLVDRLVEAGADLSEFVSGAGETLRALLVTAVGGEPEGLTERMQQLIRTYSGALPAPDVVRLLLVLSEMEERIRRGGNTRLAVELLLLRWAMMDRTVDLAQVIDALGQGKGEGGRGKGSATPPVPPHQLRDSSPAPAAPVPLPAPSPLGSPVPVEKGPLTLAHLRRVWPSIVADARAKAPMLGSLLAEATPAAVDGAVVTLRPASVGHAEGLERQRDLLSQVIARYVADPVRVKLAPAGGGEGTPVERPVRLTEEGANAERLKALRGKDPTLNAAVDALDLELLE